MKQSSLQLTTFASIFSYKPLQYVLTFLLIAGSCVPLFSQQHSVARQWNEALLEAIRRDFARPTVHARNLFHSSVVMYDAWAAYEPGANTFFLGKSLGGFECPFDGIPIPQNRKAAQEEAMSYAMYRLLSFRFQGSPNAALTQFQFNLLMQQLGYDTSISSTDYQDGKPAHLGNHIAQQMLQFGFQDGANELGSYENLYYEPINPNLVMDDPGNPTLVDPNRWQPLTITNFVDQSGNPTTDSPPFLSPEWGNVVPFAMTDEDRDTFMRDGYTYYVWHNPGPPPHLDPTTPSGLEDNYKWTFSLAAVWSSHLDPTDGEFWDISPASIGNNPALPESFDDYDQFYNFLDGGDSSQGYDVNPATGQPYEPQFVPRGDYARVLAEFWADGPHSETPPGHWFVITNYVNDHPLLEKRWKGEGPILDDLEWDVKTYFALGGAMHDAAVAAWSVKGWYDYIRPVSAIRYLGGLGQSSDENLPSYNPGGIPLVPGKIELVEAGDPLAGANDENVGKIKLLAWRGPDYIDDPETDDAGVGWILADNWWPYQRPTFVTPPFAGFVSGHSTYSRTAAELLSVLTGDPYFPGGMGEFEAPENDFLVFEEGPSVDLTLQWAKYVDASDQCSLSRIWGGIHPPADDIPGRKMGQVIGVEAFQYADSFIQGRNPEVTAVVANDTTITRDNIGEELVLAIQYNHSMDVNTDPTIVYAADDPTVSAIVLQSSEWTSNNTYTLRYLVLNTNTPLLTPLLQISGAVDDMGNEQEHYAARPFQLDTQAPSTNSLNANKTLLTDADLGTASFMLNIVFSEAMDTMNTPTFIFPAGDLVTGLSLNEEQSSWVSESEFTGVFDLADNEESQFGVSVELSNVQDLLGNTLSISVSPNIFNIDTRNPQISMSTSNVSVLNEDNVGQEALQLTFNFDENMDITQDPMLSFPQEDPLANSLSFNAGASLWQNATTYIAVFDLADADEELANIDIQLEAAKDVVGNDQVVYSQADALGIDTKVPELTSLNNNSDLLTDAEVGSGNFTLVITFDEPMDQTQAPGISFPDAPAVANSLTSNVANSVWVSPNVYRASFDVIDDNIELEDVDITVDMVKDAAGNSFAASTLVDRFSIDTRNPALLFIAAEPNEITEANVGSEGFTIVAIFDQPLEASAVPDILFPAEMPQSLTLNTGSSGWLNASTYQAVFDVANVMEILPDVDISLGAVEDEVGNPTTIAELDLFSINIDEDVNVNELPEAFQGLKLFPNPVAKGSVLQLEMTDMPKDLLVRVLNAQGQYVGQSRADGSNRLSIATEHWPAGQYVLQLFSKEGEAAVWFSIQ